jgi:SAM-dependent methyltransferase
MFEADLDLLRCPKSKQPLTLRDITSVDVDGEIMEAALVSGVNVYPVRNGIPRFTEDVSDNASWDYKWRVLDAGVGYNYRVIDKADQAYSVHDTFDRNDHDGLAYRNATGKLALDVGCGVGQYSIRLLNDYNPAKLIAFDLTSGVDIFRKIMLERYPQYKSKLLILQASVFEMPFAEETFDFIFSLGVLMHTGRTLTAIDKVLKLLKNGGEINIWIYCSEPVAYEAIEPGRETVLNLQSCKPFLRRQRFVIGLIHLFRKMKHDHVVRILRWRSSDFVKWLTQVKFRSRHLFGLLVSINQYV